MKANKHFVLRGHRPKNTHTQSETAARAIPFFMESFVGYLMNILRQRINIKVFKFLKRNGGDTPSVSPPFFMFLSALKSDIEGY